MDSSLSNFDTWKNGREIWNISSLEGQYIVLNVFKVFKCVLILLK